jgi:hypothetical protein
MLISRNLAAIAAGVLIAISTGCSSPDQENVAASKAVQDDIEIAGVPPGTPHGAARNKNPIVPDAVDMKLSLTCHYPGPCDKGPGTVRTVTTDLADQVYALGKRADAGQRTVTFDKIDWFFGSAAAAACRADKIKIPPTAWCNDFYYRNRNHLQRTVRLAHSATISLVDYYSTASPPAQKPATLQALGRRFDDSETILVMTIRDGLILDIQEQFTP